jgi:2-polyprenyl-3-methyl-5-hydroxy-6-metoxy-1,4-benzoquinol methylase
MTQGADFPEYVSESAEVWDSLAEWWDDAIGDGNPWQDLLIEPVQERLLAICPGEELLDIACGAGRFTRRMAAAGARIVAFDHAARFIARARQRTPPELTDRIDYRVFSAADSAALLALGAGRFDAAVCTMGLMDMASITPLLSVLPELLKPGGRFVFSVTHPVFNSGDASLIGETVHKGTRLDTELSIKITDYMTPRMQRDFGVPGQPVQHHDFHRPLSVLLNACFDHDLVLDRLEEPAFPLTGAASERTLRWEAIDRLPPVLVARLRLRSDGRS